MLNLIIFGPPGAGKGTQAILLSEKFGLHYIETSKVLEDTYAAAKEGDFLEVDGEKFYIADEYHQKYLYKRSNYRVI